MCRTMSWSRWTMHQYDITQGAGGRHVGREKRTTTELNELPISFNTTRRHEGGASTKSGASTLAGSSDGDAATVEAWGDFLSSETSTSASGGSIANSSGSTDGNEGPSSADSGEGVASVANSSFVTSGNGRGRREQQRQRRRGSVRNENGERDTRERHRHGRKLPRPTTQSAPGGRVRLELGPPVQLLERSS